MKCDNCHDENAVIHIKQIMGTDVRDVHICARCAGERGILGDGKDELSLPEILNALIEDAVAANNLSPDNCPSCGLRAGDVDKEGRIGCPDCINTFSRELSQALNNRNITPPHSGKLPGSLKTVRTLLIDKENLKSRLSEALKTENYETAALLRDRIRALEAEVSHES